MSSVTSGIDALGEVSVRLQDKDSGRIVFGRSSNTDVIVASAQVFIRKYKLKKESKFNEILFYS